MRPLQYREAAGAFASETLCPPGSRSPRQLSLQRNKRFVPCCSTGRRTAGRSPDSVDRRTLLLGTALASCAIGSAGAPPPLPSSTRASTTPLLLPCVHAATLVDEDVATAVFQTVRPSVVSIAVIRSVAGAPVRDLLGSGVLWDAVGPHVLTNFHIIPPLQGSSTLLQVTLTDAMTGATRTVGALVAGSDSLHDLAVLRLLPPGPPAQEPPQGSPAGSVEVGGAPLEEAGAAAASTGLAGGQPVPAGGAEEGSSSAAALAVTPIRAGTSADLRVGQSVYALGCLAGADSSSANWSLSAGLVSGMDRSIPSPVGARIYGIVQTDAIINAANSGGPLVDSFGRMVGLSTAVGSTRAGMGRGSGVNFALPVDQLRDLVPKIIVYGNAYGKK